MENENDDAAGRILTRRELISLIGSAGILTLAGCGTSGTVTPSVGTTGTTAGTTTGTTTTSGTTAGTTAGTTTGTAATTGTTAGTTTGTATTAGTTAGTTTAAATTGSTSGTSSRAVTPEGEIGPYFTDDSAAAFNRSNILTNVDGSGAQAGIPLSLTLQIFDTQNSNAPMVGVQVDIWHCNAVGVYSNEAVENTLGQTWLRGYQITDGNGQVTFNTIFPGWYGGRTTHIHLRIRSKYSQASSTSDGTNTTQVFFPQATVDTISTTVSPYSTKGVNPTTNLLDHVYTSETHALTELVLSGSSATGFTAAFSIYLPITTE